MCSFCRQKCGPRPKLFLRLDIFSTFRSVHILIFSHVPYIVIGLVREEPANFYREKRWKKSCFRDWPFVYFSGGSSLICWVTTQILICGNQTIWRLEIVLGTTAHPPLHSPPHKHTHTHTNKKDTVCLMTSAHPTSSPTQPFSNSHHDVRTSFLITQLLENKRKFYPISLESSHERNSTVPIFNKSKKSIQT